MKITDRIFPPPYAQKALETLGQHGFAACLVGGCVRDALLGSEPNDWDIATSALPNETAACFRGLHCIETGMRHGTVTVVLDGHPVEITTFRKDGAYQDHRRPETVEFSRQLEEDLSRRDFTINALAWDPKNGVTDLFGGREDLNAHVLRCVGDPLRRFEEDALRILRCLRFASTLSFSIENDTAFAMERQKELLLHISHERVREELTKLLVGKNTEKVLLEYGSILFTVIPELSLMKGCGQENPYHCYDVWEHSLRALGAVPQKPVLRWAALLHDCGKPAAKFYDKNGTAHFYGHEKKSVEIAGSVLDRLRFSNRDTQDILTLIAAHGEVLPVPEKRVRRLLGKLGPEQLFALLKLMHGDLSGQAPSLYQERSAMISEAENCAKKLLKEEERLTLRTLAVNGRDLMSIGVPPGPEMGRILKALLDLALDGKLSNERSILLEEAQKIKLSFSCMK